MSAPFVQVPARFNIASVLVDEHIQAGRGKNIAIFYGDQTFNYEQVQEGVNRAGNALRALGIVGGTGTLSGPVLGAATVRLLRNFASSYTERWETIVGLVFILFVIFAPRGIIGLLAGKEGEKGE